MSKVKIKKKYQDDSKAFEVFSIDAKEILEKGEYELVESKSVNKHVRSVSIESDYKNKFNNMNTRELLSYVKSNAIEIEGFEKMNLVDKRTTLNEFFNKS